MSLRSYGGLDSVTILGGDALHVFLSERRELLVRGVTLLAHEN